MIFKSTIYPEWCVHPSFPLFPPPSLSGQQKLIHIPRFTDRIQPWLHYVPVQLDFTDLYDALAFFRGDENGEGGHDALARKIAVEGRKWSKKYWRREDLQAYFIR